MSSYTKTLIIEDFPLIGNDGAIIESLEIETIAYDDDIESIHWDELRICTGETDITLDPRIDAAEPLYRLIAAQLNTPHWQDYISDRLSEAMANDGIFCGTSYADDHRLTSSDVM